MSWFVYRRFPAEQNLAQVSAYLNTNRVPHRFVEEGAEQVLWLADEQLVPSLDNFFVAYSSGQIDMQTAAVSERGDNKLWQSMLINAFRLPLTSLMIVLGIVGFILVDVLQSQRAFQALAFMPPEYLTEFFQPWRLISPVFLHFSVLHIVMNALWLWVLGEKIEMHLGRGHFMALFLISAIASNCLQFYAVKSVYFGGLSGVVYGFLGFISVAYLGFKQQQLMIANGIIVFSVAMMALGFMGALDWLTEGGIANWAHLGGFISGCIYAAVLYVYRQYKQNT